MKDMRSLFYYIDFNPKYSTTLQKVSTEVRLKECPKIYREHYAIHLISVKQVGSRYS